MRSISVRWDARLPPEVLVHKEIILDRAIISTKFIGVNNN